MQLKRIDFKEISIGATIETAPDSRVFIPSRSRKEEPPPPPPTFNQDQMLASEREGFKKGFAAGEKEGYQRAQSEQAEINRQLATMKEQFIKSVTPLFDHYRQMVLQAQKDIPAIAYSIAKKVASDALQQNAQDVINEIAMRTCENMITEPELTIVTHESMADTLETKLKEMGQRLPAATRIIIVRAPEMPLSDCRIEWKNGSLERVTSQLWQQVDKALSNITVVANRDAIAQMENLETQVNTANETPSIEKE